MVMKIGTVSFALLFLLLDRPSHEAIFGFVELMRHQVAVHAPLSYFMLAAPMVALLLLLTWPNHKPSEFEE